jgi:DNA-binding NarL/FixJ family response regulator
MIAMALRVAVVDDVAEMRVALTELLSEPHVIVVGTACDGVEAVELARRERPAVIVMDMRMPNMDGIDATAEICRADPPPRVLMLSAYGDESLLREALSAGVWSFLIKGLDPLAVVEAVHATSRGDHVFSAELEPLVRSVAAGLDAHFV